MGGKHCPLRDLNMSIMRGLKDMEYSGKTALTAINQHEVDVFEKAGADVVFRPFNDAAEQAADALTHAMDVLPENIDWPAALREIRIQSGSAYAGMPIRNIPLRSTASATILAVSRGGRVHFDPEPDFRIYPNDRLVIMGALEDIRKADELLNQFDKGEESENASRFVFGEIKVDSNSPLSEKTLADIMFKQKHGVTVVGIRRGEEKITSPGPNERIAGDDCLIVIGSAANVDAVKSREPL